MSLPKDNKSDANKATDLQWFWSVLPKAIPIVASFSKDRQQLATKGGGPVPPSDGMCLYNTLYNNKKLGQKYTLGRF